MKISLINLIEKYFQHASSEDTSDYNNYYPNRNVLIKNCKNKDISKIVKNVNNGIFYIYTDNEYTHENIFAPEFKIKVSAFKLMEE